MAMIFNCPYCIIVNGKHAFWCTYSALNKEQSQMDIFQHVAEELKKACFERFKSTWSDEQARAFAKIAVAAVKYWEAINITSNTEYKTVQIFGHTGEEIAKILEQHYKGQSQMTRQEALLKVQAIFESKMTNRQMKNAAFVDALEVLGLIKFDPEIKEERTDWPIIRACGITKDNMMALFNKGYDIRKIGT